MPDITMCKGEKCEAKESCYRFTAEPNIYQSYFMDSPGHDKNCPRFWPVEVKPHSKSEAKCVDTQTDKTHDKA